KFEVGKFQIFGGDSLRLFRIVLSERIGIRDAKHPIQDIDRDWRRLVTTLGNELLERSFQLQSGSHLQKGMAKVTRLEPFFLHDFSRNGVATHKVIFILSDGRILETDMREKYDFPARHRRWSTAATDQCARPFRPKHKGAIR